MCRDFVILTNKLCYLQIQANLTGKVSAAETNTMRVVRLHHLCTPVISTVYSHIYFSLYKTSKYTMSRNSRLSALGIAGIGWKKELTNTTICVLMLKQIDL